MVPQAQWADFELVILAGHDTDLEPACPRAALRCKSRRWRRNCAPSARLDLRRDQTTRTAVSAAVGLTTGGLISDRLARLWPVCGPSIPRPERRPCRFHQSRLAQPECAPPLDPAHKSGSASSPVESSIDRPGIPVATASFTFSLTCSGSTAKPPWKSALTGTATASATSRRCSSA